MHQFINNSNQTSAEEDVRKKYFNSVHVSCLKVIFHWLTVYLQYYDITVNSSEWENSIHQISGRVDFWCIYGNIQSFWSQLWKSIGKSILVTSTFRFNSNVFIALLNPSNYTFKQFRKLHRVSSLVLNEKMKTSNIPRGLNGFHVDQPSKLKEPDNKYHIN